MNGPQTYFKPNIIGRLIGMQPGSCKCGGRCGGLNGLGEDAHGVTRQNAAGERAQAITKFINNVSQRTAGGMSLGDNELTYVAQELAKLPQNLLQYMTLPGLTYTVVKKVWDTGKQTAQTIGTEIKNNPVLKQNIKDISKKVLTYGKDILDTVVAPVKGVSTLISWLPWITIGVLVIFAIMAFQGNISTPKKFSLT